jgi:multiple sugar transport system substrate-binding protein
MSEHKGPSSTFRRRTHQPRDRVRGTSSTISTGARPTTGISRRGFIKLLGTAAAGGALAACTPAASGLASHTEGPVQLVYQDWRTEWFPGMAQRMLEKFYVYQPNIRVFYTPDPENLADKMISDFQAGTAPDVMAGCCDFFPAWAQQGYLLDLRPYVEADLDKATLDDWDPAQYRALFSRDGAQYALPKYHGALALYYNKDLFDERRVDYPNGSWSHDDYREAMRRMTRDTASDGTPDVWGSMVDIGWERLQVHVNGWGGHFVDPGDPTKSKMADMESLDALEWVRERMWTDRTMASSLDIKNIPVRDAFVHGQLAMVEDGSWSLKDILETTTFRVGVSPFPAGPKRRVTLATTDGFGIYAGTRSPDAAWELLKFLISPDYGRAMASAHLLQPARASLVDEWVADIREEYPDKAREMDIAAFAEGHLQGYSVTAEIFANMSPASRLAQGAWEQIFTLGQAPVDLIKEVSAEIEQAQKTAEEAS